MHVKANSGAMFSRTLGGHSNKLIFHKHRPIFNAFHPLCAKIEFICYYLLMYFPHDVKSCSISSNSTTKTEQIRKLKLKI